MDNKIVLSIMVFCFLFIVKLNAQDQKNMLEPCLDPYYDVDLVYQNQFDSIINANLSSNYLIRYIVKPAFDVEYGFQIIQNKSGNYQVQAYSLSENLWYAQSANAVKVNLHTMNISEKLFLEIDYLFSHFTDPDRIAYEKQVTCTDGIVCKFIRNTQQGQTCGVQHSPKKDTQILDFVEICNLLFSNKAGVNLLQINQAIKNLNGELEY